MFHKNYSAKVFRKLSSYRFAFDVELTLILKRNKISIQELPLRWTHKNESKLNLIKDTPIMFFDILIIKFKEIFK